MICRMGLASMLVAALTACTGPARLAEPADQPTPPESWRMSHNVRPPEGWRIVDRTLYGTGESTTLQRTTEESCSVQVWSDAQFDAASDVGRRTEITIGGRPGFTGTGSTEGAPALYWSYRDDEWASVMCTIDDDFVSAAQIATETIFEPISLYLPIRLRAASEGYQLSLVSEHHLGTGSGYLTLEPTVGGSEQPDIFVGLGRGESNIQPSTPGYETATVAGRPAVLQAASGSLDLKVGEYLIGIQVPGGSRQDPARWPAGRRELLIQVAESVELATDLGDRSTWFDARDAVPR